MDNLWLLVGLVLWVLEAIWENGKSLLIGGLIGIAVLFVAAAIQQTSTARQREEERLQQRVQDLERELDNAVNDLRDQLSRMEDRLDQIEKWFSSR